MENTDKHYVSLLALLDKAIPRMVPESLEDRIFLKSKTLLRKEQKRFRLIRYGFAMAAGLLIVSGALWLLAIKTPKSGNCFGCWNFVDGDAANSRHSESDFIPTEVTWQAPVTAQSGIFRPLAWKDLLIVGAGQGLFQDGGGLIALDSKNGLVRWKRDFPKGDFYKTKRFPDRCVHQRALYITDGGKCHVIDPLTGKVLRHLAPPDSIGGWNYLTAANNRLFGASGDGRTIFCLNPADGKALWTRKLDSPVFIPALSGNRLFCHTESGTLHAIRLKDGADAWQNKAVGITARASAHAYNGYVAILGQDDSLAMISAKTGRLLWKRNAEGLHNAGLAMGDSAVYLKGGALAFSLNQGALLFSKSATAGTLLCSAPTLLKNHLVSASGMIAGNLKILSTSGSPIRYLHTADAGACDGAIVMNNRIFTVGNGRITAFGDGSGI